MNIFRIGAKKDTVSTDDDDNGCLHFSLGHARLLCISSATYLTAHGLMYDGLSFPRRRRLCSVQPPGSSIMWIVGDMPSTAWS